MDDFAHFQVTSELLILSSVHKLYKMQVMNRSV